MRPLGLTQYDDTGGNIGKRYRRQDEIGTPYCVTVDFQSLEDQQVTIRERDSMQQRRVPIAELRATLAADLGLRRAVSSWPRSVGARHASPSLL